MLLKQSQIMLEGILAGLEREIMARDEASIFDQLEYFYNPERGDGRGFYWHPPEFEGGLPP